MDVDIDFILFPSISIKNSDLKRQKYIRSYQDR
jgi:hypothetical protein